MHFFTLLQKWQILSRTSHKSKWRKLETLAWGKLWAEGSKNSIAWYIAILLFFLFSFSFCKMGNNIILSQSYPLSSPTSLVPTPGCLRWSLHVSLLSTQGAPDSSLLWTQTGINPLLKYKSFLFRPKHISISLISDSEPLSLLCGSIQWPLPKRQTPSW